MAVVKRFSELGPAERNQFLRLLSMRLALEAFKDPALTDQVSAAQVTGARDAINFAIAGIQKGTAPAYQVPDPPRLKVVATPDGRVWIRLDAVVGDVVFLDEIDTRVAELNAAIVAVEGQQLTLEEKRTEGHRMLDESPSVEEFFQNVVSLIQASQHIAPQIEGLIDERDALLALKADVEG